MEKRCSLSTSDCRDLPHPIDSRGSDCRPHESWGEFMTSDMAIAIAGRHERFAAISKEYPEHGVEFVQIHMPDLTGLLRTKYAPFKMSETGESFNAILFNVAHSDGAPIGDVVFDAPICWLDNGYGSIQALADPDSAVIHGWRPNVCSIMLDTFMADGSACEIDLRQRLKRIEDQAHDMGFEAKIGFEIEFGLFHYDEELVQQGRYAELRPHGKSFTNYDMLRAPGYEDLMQEFIHRMKSLDYPVASFVSEYGRGMYEFAMKPLAPLAAADGITRAKHHLKELCLERGLIATFMTRFQGPGGESSSGTHIHQCLVDAATGANVFHDPDGGLSQTARHYAAGLLATMADFHAVFRPTVNSYRRMDRQAWSPEEIYWGIENRTAPVRAITRPDANACRMEHRCAGSDVNPYLAVMATLGPGLKAVAGKWEPWELVPGISRTAQEELPLHRSLADALAQFRTSTIAAEILGTDLHEQYVLSRENELAAFETWQAQNITSFEYQRYFEGV